MPKFKLEDGTEFEIPEGFANIGEFLTAFTTAQQQLPQAQQSAQQFDEFKKTWGDPSTLRDRLNQHIQAEVEKAKAAVKDEGGTRKEQKQAGDAVLDNWAELTPQQQIDYMTNSLSTSLSSRLDSMVAEKWKVAESALGNATQMNQQQFDLLARAFDAKVANPKLNLRDVWDNMTKLAKASPEELMSLAMKQVTATDDLSTRIGEERAKWEEERGKKDAADRLNVLNSGSLQSWMKPKERPVSLVKDGEEAFKRGILEKALQNGQITPDQI